MALTKTEEEVRELTDKVIELFGREAEKHGFTHIKVDEMYAPETEGYQRFHETVRTQVIRSGYTILN